MAGTCLCSLCNFVSSCQPIGPDNGSLRAQGSRNLAPSALQFHNIFSFFHSLLVIIAVTCPRLPAKHVELNGGIFACSFTNCHVPRPKQPAHGRNSSALLSDATETTRLSSGCCSGSSTASVSTLAQRFPPTTDSELENCNKHNQLPHEALGAGGYSRGQRSAAPSKDRMRRTLRRLWPGE